MAGVCGEGSAQPRSSLDVVLADLVRGKVPGICAVVVHGDQVVQARALGLADIASARPMTSETAFLWFSMTKIVTATAVMQLVERGRLGLDDAVRSFVPEFPEPPKGWPEVRISHLLSHGSGLANPIPVRWV